MKKFEYSAPTLAYQNLSESLGFRLRLANNQEWTLFGTEEVNPWLQKLASLLQLKTCKLNGSPLIICKRKSSDDLVEGIDFTIVPTDQWKETDFRVGKIWTHAQSPHVIFELNDDEGLETDIIRIWHLLSLIYQKVQASGGMPFHAGLVQKNGKGYLLAAPGNTGKSTCCSRIVPPWQAISDDEVVIVKGDAGKYLVHPVTTWSNYLWKNGKEQPQEIEKFWPLHGIFFLEQSETDEVVEIGKGTAALSAYESASQVGRRNRGLLNLEQERKTKHKVFDNAIEMMKKIPAYKLKVNLTGKFWEKMDEVVI